MGGKKKLARYADVIDAMRGNCSRELAERNFSALELAGCDPATGNGEMISCRVFDGDPARIIPCLSSILSGQ
jgi:hypothetical protein